MPLEHNISKEENEFTDDPILGDVLSGGKVVIDGNLYEEDRGYRSCAEPQWRFCDVTSADRQRNDVTSAWRGGDTVSFKLFKEDGTQSAYSVTAVAFVNQANAFYCTIEWRDVVIADGVISGCYTLETTSTIASVTQIKINWGVYKVQPYEISGEINPILLKSAPVRLLSEFNDMNDQEGFDFTNSRILDCVRLDAKFGYFNDNTEIDNVEYLDGKVEKVKNEDFVSYELRLNASGYCHVEPLRFHLLAANNMWATDQNPDSYDYFIKDRYVIRKEGFEPDHIDGVRKITGVAKFQLKIRKRRTHFNNNRITAEEVAPPALSAICPPCPPLVGSTSTMLMGSGLQTSYRTGDDKSIDAGREVDFFTLSTANGFGNTDRFTDTLGGQTYANDIVIDWAHRDYTANTVLSYYRVLRVATNWDDAIDTALALSVTGFTSGWYLPNVIELFNLVQVSTDVTVVLYPLNYAPFNFTNNLNYWTSTTRPISTTQALKFFNNSAYAISTAAKSTAGYSHFYARHTLLTELGL